MNQEEYDRQREMMVKLIIERGVTDEAVLKALRKVKRHLFVPENCRDYAYEDGPLVIGCGQTISQPYMVAYMTAVLALDAGDKVLEVGTGTGYQTAVLAEIAENVYSLETIEELAEKAKERLDRLRYDNIHIKVGSGYSGWEQYAPYDAVIVTAAPAEIPSRLVDQLKDGGKMVLPLGNSDQELVLIKKEKEKIIQENHFPVRFVPMVEEDADDQE